MQNMTMVPATSPLMTIVAGSTGPFLSDPTKQILETSSEVDMDEPLGEATHDSADHDADDSTGRQ